MSRNSATAAVSKAIAISRMPEERRMATLVAFAYVLESTATDDALDLLELLIGELLATSKRTGQQERLRTIKDLDAAALRLCEACAVLLDPTCDDPQVRSVIFGRIAKEKLSLFCHSPKTFVISKRRELLQIRRSPAFF
jgi:hypothetical protein